MTAFTTKQIQQALLSHGESLGPDGADGVWGRNSIAAAKRFQRSKGLDPDGVVGRETLKALGLVSPALPANSPTLSPPPVWYSEARRKMGLHEKQNNDELKKFLKSDGHTLGDPAKLPWCFTGETEILTGDGWQRLDNLSAAQVWQVNQEGGMSLTAYEPVSKDYEGQAFVIDSAAVQATCDTEHKWWGSWYNKAEPKFDNLSSLKSSGLAIAAPYSLSKGADLTAQQLGFLAAFISDGFYHRGNIEIQVSKPRKLATLRQLNPSGEHTTPRVYGDTTKIPLTTFYFKTPTWFSSVFTDYKDLNYDFVCSLSQKQAQQFLHEFSVFDGHTRDDGRITLYTSHPPTRDALITICTLAGYLPRLEPGGMSELTQKPSWRIGFTPKTNMRKRITKEDVIETHYSGKMYCVSVPDGRIVIRGPNLEPCVTGNCGDFVETCIALTLPDEQMVVNPYYALNWLKFGVALTTPTLGCILVFQRPGGGHVGFYVGETATHYRVLGGNQSDRVTDSALIAKERCKGFRWPATAPLPTTGRTQVSGGTVSHNEA